MLLKENGLLKWMPLFNNDYNSSVFMLRKFKKYCYTVLLYIKRNDLLRGHTDKEKRSHTK